MLHTTTPTGMRTLAGDYREADVRWADARRADRAAKAAPAANSAPAAPVERHTAPHRIGWLTSLIPHQR